MKGEVKVFAPASIGNIGPGFDVLGVAVGGPGDVVDVEFGDFAGVRIEEIGGWGKGLPLDDPAKNTASRAAMNVLERTGRQVGITMRIDKGVPFPSGLGSSAASAIAGGMAANELLGRPLSRKELLVACTEAEEAVSGGYFADNTAAALYGGAVITKITNREIDVISLGGIEDARLVVVRPHYAVRTQDARNVLPREVPMNDFIANMSGAATITAAFLFKDVEMFGRAVVDRVAEPARAGLIPGFADVKAAALETGALGCSISGAGPSVFAVARACDDFSRIGDAMKSAFGAHGLDADVFLCCVDMTGARVIA